METTATMQPVTALKATPTSGTEGNVRTKEFMLDYLDNAVVGLHWVDGEGTIIWANKADYEPLGYSEDEYLGHNITEFPRRRGGDQRYPRAAPGRSIALQLSSSAPAQGRVDPECPHRFDGLFDGAKKFVHTRCFTINDPT